MAWATATKVPSTIIPSDRDRWERLAFIAWIALVAAWLWPIVTLVLNAATQAGPRAHLFGWDSLDILQFDRNIALVGVVAFPTLAAIAVALGLSSRANVKRTRHRGGFIATGAVIAGCVTLLASAIWMIAVLVAAVGFPIDIGF